MLAGLPPAWGIHNNTRPSRTMNAGAKVGWSKSRKTKNALRRFSLGVGRNKDRVDHRFLPLTRQHPYTAANSQGFH